MLKQLRTALIIFCLLTGMTGIIYPAAVTLVAQSIFPSQANGSLITSDNGRVMGSDLIGQAFDDPRYFWGRPSATADGAYNAAASGGSNLGPANPELAATVAKRTAALKAADPENTLPVPVDLVTASASGLDPDISPAAAQYQAGRVARARNLPLEQVQLLIIRHTTPPFLGLIGEARVNVLRLNMALDGLE